MASASVRVSHDYKRQRVQHERASGYRSGDHPLWNHWADALGIDWRSCPTIPFIGIGAKNIGHVAKLNLRLPSVQYTWTADVAFSEAMNSIKFPLLGHIGFFDRFTVTFRPRAFKLFLAADEDLR